VLKSEIMKDGEIRHPLVIDKDDQVIDGRNRLAIAKELGMDVVPFAWQMTRSTPWISPFKAPLSAAI